MSRRHFFMQASKKEEGSGNLPAQPEVNRFSDIREVDHRRHEVLDHLMMGYEAEEIADFMGQSVTVIKNDIKKIMELGYVAREEDVDAVRDEMMRTYRQVKKEAYRAFRMSQGAVEKVTYEEGTGSDGGYTKTKTVTEEKSGDPRFLNVMVDATKEMGKASGAQKHKEIQIENNTQNNNLAILSPNRTQMPEDFDRWTKKPEDEEIPSSEGIKSEDL
jgi:predicted transcriptional regulator